MSFPTIQAEMKRTLKGQKTNPMMISPFSSENEKKKLSGTLDQNKTSMVSSWEQALESSSSCHYPGALFQKRKKRILQCISEKKKTYSSMLKTQFSIV